MYILSLFLEFQCFRSFGHVKFRSFPAFFIPIKFLSFLAFFSRSNSAHSLHFLFRSNSAHFLHFFYRFRSFRSVISCIFLSGIWADSSTWVFMCCYIARYYIKYSIDLCSIEKKNRSECNFQKLQKGSLRRWFFWMRPTFWRGARRVTRISANKQFFQRPHHSQVICKKWDLFRWCPPVSYVMHTPVTEHVPLHTKSL